MRNCWLSPELGAGIPRANNSLERFNGHVKKNFAENILLPVNGSMGNFMTWSTNEYRRDENAHAHAPTDHIAGKLMLRLLV